MRLLRRHQVAADTERSTVKAVRSWSDSPLEGSGFEPVSGFSCQVVFLVCCRLAVKLFGPIELRHPIDQRQPASGGTLAIVLVRLRTAEINQDSVAHIAGDKPAKTLDDLCDAAMVSADDPTQILGIKPRGQRRRADQIAEHHRQLSPLCSGGNGWRGLGQGLQRLRPERGD
jgi:hypothetical protein